MEEKVAVVVVVVKDMKENVVRDKTNNTRQMVPSLSIGLM